MANQPKESEIKDREYRLLTRVKEMITQPLVSEDNLIDNLREIIEEHEGNVLPDQPTEVLEMKGRLLTHITHEFLTPLNLIITPLEQMLPRCENPEQKQLLSMMYRNSQRLLLVITQILELLKLESMKLKLKMECIKFFAIIFR